MLDTIYWLCVDACIHLGNLFGITYDGVNFWLFIVGMPLILLLLLLVNLWKWGRYFWRKG